MTYVKGYKVMSAPASVETGTLMCLEFAKNLSILKANKLSNLKTRFLKESELCI